MLKLKTTKVKPPPDKRTFEVRRAKALDKTPVVTSQGVEKPAWAILPPELKKRTGVPPQPKYKRFKHRTLGSPPPDPQLPLLRQKQREERQEEKAKQTDYEVTLAELQSDPRRQQALFRKLLATASRDHLGYFGEFVAGFRPLPHHDIWIEALMSDDDVLIIAPFGHHKTGWLTNFCAWSLGRDPSLHILYLSSTQQQANKPSVAIRDLIDYSPEFAEVFPLTRPNKSKGWAEDEWYLRRSSPVDKDPSFFASGVLSSSVLGSRADILVWDDVSTQENQATPYLQEKNNDWLRTTARSRLKARGGRLVAIMTRWSKGDAASILEARPGCRIILMPALGYWEQLAGIELDDPIAEGSALCPEIQTKEQLLALFAEDPHGFILRYQGDVQSDTGSIFKDEYWRYYLELPEERPLFVVQSWDTAFKAKQSSDYSVCFTFYVYPDHVLVVDRIKERLTYPELLRSCVSAYEKWRPDLVLVEDKASGTSLIQTLQATTMLPILAKPADIDLVRRAHSTTGLLQAGRVFLPANATWTRDFFNETRAFPDPAVHDDQIAAFVQFCEWVQLSPIRIDPYQFFDAYGHYGNSIPTIGEGLGSPLMLGYEERGMEVLAFDDDGPNFGWV